MTRRAPFSARRWKEHYAAERASLGDAGLAALLDRAPDVALPDRGALVFPHVHLGVAGALTAAVARACVRSGRADVLALGVLHGAREVDRPRVEAARAGDAAALAELRGIHGPDSPLTQEEFSLDGFAALLEVAARREGRPAPRLHARYPFLVGLNPNDLPGLSELEELARGAAVVATCDPIHHGEGYGTPRKERRALDDAATHAWARATIESGLAPLGRGDFAVFLDRAAAAKSDFRDPGAVLAALAAPRALAFEVRELVLADYAATLDAKPPTWVAGALVVARAG